jgi:GINS complex subunit 3
MEYYNIDDILARESRLKVRFNHRIHNFGFLPLETQTHIPKGKKVEAPYFLVSFLLRNDHCMVAEELIGDVLLSDLRAKPSLVDLGSICKYFFFLYSELVPSIDLRTFFLERMDDYSALMLKEGLSGDDTWRLDAAEKRLIANSRRRFQAFRRFFIGKHE